MRAHYLSLVFFLCCVSAYAIASEFNHQFYLGPQHAYQRLKFNNPGKLDGFITGFATGFEFSRKWFVANLAYEGYWSTGLLHGNPCQVSKVREHILPLYLGGRWQPRECFSLEGYTGLGFNRFWNHQDPATDECQTSCSQTCPTTCAQPCTKACGDSSSCTSSCTNTSNCCIKDCKISCRSCCTYPSEGLRYRYHKLFVPIRLDFNWHATNFTTISLRAEWRPDVYARLNVLCSDIHNDRSHAVRVSLPIRHEIQRNDRFVATFEPFFDWNRFGGLCCLNQNGNPYGLCHLTRWDIGMRCMLGVQF